LASSAVTFRSAGLGSSAGLGISMRSTTPGSLDGTGRRSSRAVVHITVRRIEQHASATSTDHHLTVIWKRSREKKIVSKTSRKPVNNGDRCCWILCFYRIVCEGCQITVCAATQNPPTTSSIKLLRRGITDSYMYTHI